MVVSCSPCLTFRYLRGQWGGVILRKGWCSVVVATCNNPRVDGEQGEVMIRLAMGVSLEASRAANNLERVAQMRKPIRILPGQIIHVY
jgi:hypothetical protein